MVQERGSLQLQAIQSEPAYPFQWGKEPPET